MKMKNQKNGYGILSLPTLLEYVCSLYARYIYIYSGLGIIYTCFILSATPWLGHNYILYIVYHIYISE